MQSHSCFTLPPMCSTRKLSHKRLTNSPNNAHSTSANLVGENDDLLTEILVRVPIRSLLKFKSVSKHWLSLITSPRFSRLFDTKPMFISGLFLQPPNPLLNFEPIPYRLQTNLHHMNKKYDFVNLRNVQNSTPFKSLNFVDGPGSLRILQSCNGLLLCCRFCRRGTNHTYYIYNPTIKQYTTLPPLNFRSRSSRYISGVNLAFDPTKSPHYKVICIGRSDTLEDHYQIEIYASDQGPWRLSGNAFTTTQNINFGGGVYWNGAVHWTSTFGNSLYFHFDTERLQELPMPPNRLDWDSRRYRYFGESRDHLHIADICEVPTTQFNVYEMERDYSKWSVKYRVNFDQAPVKFTDGLDTAVPFMGFSILCLVREERDEDSYLVLHVPGKVLRYDLQSGSFEILCDFSPGKPVFDEFEVDDSGENYYLDYEWSDAYQNRECLSCV